MLFASERTAGTDRSQGKVDDIEHQRRKSILHPRFVGTRHSSIDDTRKSAGSTDGGQSAAAASVVAAAAASAAWASVSMHLRHRSQLYLLDSRLYSSRGIPERPRQGEQCIVPHVLHGRTSPLARSRPMYPQMPHFGGCQCPMAERQWLG